jgi:mannan endo-1,4-beta-mannosidase
VGGRDGQQTHLKVDGLTASRLTNTLFNPGIGGYGGVIDGLGNLWSVTMFENAMRFVPPTNLPPTSQDWSTNVVEDAYPYGIAVDPLYPYIYATSGREIFRWATNGTTVTNTLGQLLFDNGGSNTAQGLAVATDGHVWVAHGYEPASDTVGHLDTNGNLIGVVGLAIDGMRGEYFDNTSLSGTPVFVETNYAMSLDWSDGSPDPAVPTNYFSARWTGIVWPLLQGTNYFNVRADTGAVYRLTVNGMVVIDTWTNSSISETSGAIWLATNTAYPIMLEYAEFTNDANIELAWIDPATSNKLVFDQTWLSAYGIGPTGASVDSAGKIWVGCFYGNCAMRIDPNAGDTNLISVTNYINGQYVVTSVTHHVGAVDMVVNLGDGTFHQSPYTNNAHPYNYSDMTGLNNQVVNSEQLPYRGYWTVIHDSGDAGTNTMRWDVLSWNATLTNGCSVDVAVRAQTNRLALSNTRFVSVTNNVPLTSVTGRYLEVRLGLTRNAVTNQPLLHDLTLYGHY